MFCFALGKLTNFLETFKRIALLFFCLKMNRRRYPPNTQSCHSSTFFFCTSVSWFFRQFFGAFFLFRLKFSVNNVCIKIFCIYQRSGSRKNWIICEKRPLVFVWLFDIITCKKVSNHWFMKITKIWDIFYFREYLMDKIKGRCYFERSVGPSVSGWNGIP